jgi:homoserine dehydrogenase
VPQAHSSAPPSDASAAHTRKSGSARHLRIAIFGFGTVGSSVARILVESKPQGLELTHIFNRNVARKRVAWVPSSVVWSEDADAVLASDVDVIVELAGGLDPAGTWVRRALEAGKSVVTANKKLIAYHGIDLERLAAAKGGHSNTALPWRAESPSFPASNRAWQATASSAWKAFSTAPATSS